MKIQYKTRGTCASLIETELDSENRISNVRFTGGCNGNQQGISKLVEGMTAQEAISKLRGIRCGSRPTSGPAPLAVALEQALKSGTEEKSETVNANAEYRKWISSPAIDPETRSQLESIVGDYPVIKEWFFAPLEFGTAGLRGKMRPGINSMNVYTVRQATQGMANLILTKEGGPERGVVIAYDSRINSRLFAEESACVLAANGIKSYIFDDIRPTPELSFAIRSLGCIAGINITASHNPKEYNGYKAYWEDGAQLPPDHAKTVSEAISATDIFTGVKRISFGEAVSHGLSVTVGAEIDDEYLGKVGEQSIYKDIIREAGADFKVIYTPLHGAGYKLVPEILRRCGLASLITVSEQMTPDGSFPTVKNPNPEYREVFDIGIELAKQNDCALIIGTDPDADRTGIVVRTGGGEYVTLSGNQTGALLLDYIITARRENGNLPEDACAIKTIVTSELAARICEANGVKLLNVLTGFKFIGEKIKEFEENGGATFIFGYEESYGYLAGTYARDKDAVVASMLVTEMAAYYYVKHGMTLYDAMQELYRKYGYFKESTQDIVMEGVDGVAMIKNIMSRLRSAETVEIDGVAVVQKRDYKTGTVKNLANGAKSRTGLPASDVLYYGLENGSAVIVRPSGTEPKIKIYYMVSASGPESAQARIDSYKKAVAAMIKL